MIMRSFTIITRSLRSSDNYMKLITDFIIITVASNPRHTPGTNTTTRTYIYTHLSKT